MREAVAREELLIDYVLDDENISNNEVIDLAAKLEHETRKDPQNFGRAVYRARKQQIQEKYELPDDYDLMGLLAEPEDDGWRTVCHECVDEGELSDSHYEVNDNAESFSWDDEYGILEKNGRVVVYCEEHNTVSMSFTGEFIQDDFADFDPEGQL